MAASATGTNIGPLTTIFTPPPSCSSPAAFVDSTGVPFQIYYGGLADGLYMAPPYSATACFPSSYPVTIADNYGGSYYSPGLCPHGYTVIPTTTVGPETRGICCWSGLDNNIGMQCTSSTTGTVTADYYVTLEPGPMHSLETGKVTATGSVDLIGSAIEVRWREGDFGSTVTLPPSTTFATPTPEPQPTYSNSIAAPGTTTSLGTFTASLSSAGSAKTTSDGSRLTMAKKRIGVGVGLALGVVLVAGLW